MRHPKLLAMFVTQKDHVLTEERNREINNNKKIKLKRETDANGDVCGLSGCEEIG